MLRVMIADDERIVRKAVRAVGRWEEYHMEIIGEAADGMEALEMIRKEEPDVVFLDMKMPGMSGGDLLEALSGGKIHPDVVIISGFDDFEYARTALKYGALDYILKPVDRNEFNRVLENISRHLAGRDKDVVLSAPDGDIASQVKERIEKEYEQDISLARFAGEYFMNKDVLSRLFKKKYGTGITDYINRVRLEQAKVLLAFGYSSTETAERTGYHDINYFSRVFKKYFAMTPSEYVIKMKKL